MMENGLDKIHNHTVNLLLLFQLISLIPKIDYDG